ncbi:hypothetical protein AAC387_Pa05g3304 [Persea americana]
METFNAISTSSYSSSSSSSSTSFNPWMDPQIWSNLPHRLLIRILAFLPPPAFFRSRCVCKRFYSLLFSDSFLEMHLHLSPHLHWFIFFKNKDLISFNHNKNTHQNQVLEAPIEGFILDPDENTWYCVSFSLIPPSFSPSSSSEGLVCWMSDEAGPKTLILYNPMSRTAAQLPPAPRPRLYPSVGLRVGPSSIDAFLAGDDLISPFAVKNLTTESFHADGGGFFSVWGTNSPLPRLCSLESGRMVLVNGCFYCMNYSPFSVLAYEIASNTWCKIQAPMRRFLRSPSLVECRGRLVLVAAVEKSKLNVPRSVRMWGLQGCGRTWVELERMPHQLYLQFADAEAGRGFDCVGNGDFIAATIRGSEQVLLFNFHRKGWSWVSQCPFLRHSGGVASGGGLHGFAYMPRLATPAIALLES